MPPLSRPACKDVAVGPVIRNGREVGSRRAFVVGVCHLPDVARTKNKMLPSAAFNRLWSMPGCCPEICPCSPGCSDEERYQANSAPGPTMRHLSHQARHKKMELKQAEGPMRKL